MSFAFGPWESAQGGFEPPDGAGAVLLERGVAAAREEVPVEVESDHAVAVGDGADLRRSQVPLVVAIVEQPPRIRVRGHDSTIGVREQIVETGERQDGWIEVRSGLAAGDVVVAEGAYYLSDGVRVVVREGGA